MSDHGTNFVGADRELKEFYDFIQLQKTQKTVSEFCSLNHIQWKYTVQDDLLARENFGDLPQDKHLANFILANLVKA